MDYFVNDALNCYALILPRYEFNRYPSWFKKNNQIKTYMRYLFEALQYLHSFEIKHRDVKPSNIGLKIKGNLLIDLVLCDFEFATDVEPYEKVGTDGYKSPEMCIHSLEVLISTDIFSAGIIFAELLRGKDNIIEEFQFKHMDLFDDDVREWSDDVGLSSVDPIALDLLEKCLYTREERRITAADALKHPYLSSL